jgi:hypothetical protein
VSLPGERLRPVWRHQPGNSGTFVMALDPAEAEFVLARGWAILDGVQYRTSLYGWDGEVEQDGRVSVRCDGPERPDVVSADPTDRWSLRGLLRVLRAA